MLDLNIHELLTLIHLQFEQPNLLAIKSTLSQSLNVHFPTSLTIGDSKVNKVKATLLLSEQIHAASLTIGTLSSI